MTDGQLTPIEGTFIDVARANKRPPQWIIQDVMPEGLLILAGPPKETFKSTIALAMGAIITSFETKALPADWVPKKDGPVMVFSHEADAGEVRFILEDGLGARLKSNESILVAARPEEFMLDTEEGQENMAYWLDERKPVLVLLDPLANFHSLEEKDSSEMIRIIAPWRRWAKENGCCFCIVHHTRKLDEDRAYKASDVRGTSALFGLCDGLLVLTPGKESYEVIIDAKMKRGKPWIKTIRLGVWDRKGLRGGEQLRTVDKLILTAIRNGYTSLVKIVKHVHLKESVVERQLAWLEKAGFAKFNKTSKRWKALTDE